MGARHWCRIAIACTLCVLSCDSRIAATQSGRTRNAYPLPRPSLEKLVTWLDDWRTAWVATAWLQQVGAPAVPPLIDAYRGHVAATDSISAYALALAKIGEPAIPLIDARLSQILVRLDQSSAGEANALLGVLGDIGPPAIPALVRVAIAAPPEYGTVLIALREIVDMEPPEPFDAMAGPWHRWQTMIDAERTREQIRRQITPLLPSVREVMEREHRRRRPGGHMSSAPPAYLLARWGNDADRARGAEVLTELARGGGWYYYSEQAIRLLQQLHDPRVPALLQENAAQVPASDHLREQVLLQRTVGLFYAGDASYAARLVPLFSASVVYARQDAIRFAGTTGDLRLVPSLIERLADTTAHNGVSTSDLAVEALGRLTFQSFGRDEQKWCAWWKRQQRTSRHDLLAEFLAADASRIESMPIWDANRIVARLNGTTDPLIFSVLRRYLDRRDLDATASGPDQHSGSAGSGPIGQYGPVVVSILLDSAEHGEPEARQLLTQAFASADASVAQYAALALAAFDRRAAADRLARDLNRRESWARDRAADFLLAIGDARGIPVLIDRLESDQPAARSLACNDLRRYTQQPLACDPDAPAGERAANVEQWRGWWTSGPQDQPKAREARLDLEARGVPRVKFRADMPVR